MSIRKEQCNKVCRILDDVLANRPTERDSLIIAVRKAFESLEQLGNSEQLPSAQPQRETGHWIEIQAPDSDGNALYECSICHSGETHTPVVEVPFCWHCGARMEVSRNDRGI